MRDEFFSKSVCDRCGASLKGNTRTMSMFNTDCLCINCKKAEKEHPLYEAAAEAELAEVQKGNLKFKGIGMPEGGNNMNMSYEEFKQEVVENFKKYLPKEFRDKELKVSQVKKTNCIMDAMSFTDYRVCPSIYINHLYESYLNGNRMTAILRNAAADFIKAFKEGKSIELDFDSARENIVFRLINTAQNQELLKDAPHRQFHDLSIIYYWLVDVEDEQCASALIHNALAEKFGLNESDLFKLAVENTRRLTPIRTTNMGEVLGWMFGVEPSEDFPMWVISTTKKMFGAMAMLYEDVLFELANKLDSDLYILPSSIHEIICLAADEGNADALMEMVHCVNAKQVLLEERLSNNVYYYSRRDRCVSMVTNSEKSLEFEAC